MVATRQKNAGRRRATRLGFTIIELLVVIGIISLLLSVVLPTMSQARVLARKTKTIGLFRALDAGLEMFHDNEYLDEGYPPSSCKPSDGWGDPFDSITDPPYVWTGNGAETLLAALMGADLRGTPGFDKTKGLSSANAGGLYELDGGDPVCRREGPFADVSASVVMEGNKDDPKPKVFIDAFTRPVLYYKAAWKEIRRDPKDIYDYDEGHNDEFLPPGGSVNEITEDMWDDYVRDTRVGEGDDEPYMPYNKEKYLLISAGADEIYGTDDDITNFPLPANKFPLDE